MYKEYNLSTEENIADFLNEHLEYELVEIIVIPGITKILVKEKAKGKTK